MRRNFSDSARLFQVSIRRSGLVLLLLVVAGDLAAQEPGRYGHYDVFDPDLPQRAEYAARRAQVMSRLDSSTAMLVRSAELLTRSNDVKFEFRQRNSMLYLTGVTEAESALLLAPRGVMVDGKKVREILFVAERNPTMETWVGVRMGPEVAPAVTGIATVLPYPRMREVIDSLIPQIGTLYYDGWLHGFEREPLSAFRSGSTKVASP